jgi:nucleotide-binding universal stress UspA family protein
VELFEFEDSEFFLLHAYADEVYNNKALLTQHYLEGLKIRTLKKSDDELESILERIKELSPNPRHSFKPISAFGILVDEVNDLVNKENADLTVMGTVGLTDDRNITFGSNTLQVLKYVQSPILCVPANHKYKTPKNLLFPTNYMIPYQIRELQLVAEIARANKTTVHMLHVSKFPLESFRRKANQLLLKEQFYETPFQFHRIDEVEKTKAIMLFTNELNIDILIMVNSRCTYLENIIYQSTIDKIGLHPRIPFLVLQNFQRGPAL